MITLKAKKAIYCQTICKAWCCKNILIHYDVNEKDIQTFFKLRGIEPSDQTNMYIVPSKCQWLTNHNKCKLYSWRPNSCRAYECETLKKMTLDS